MRVFVVLGRSGLSASALDTVDGDTPHFLEMSFIVIICKKYPEKLKSLIILPYLPFIVNRFLTSTAFDKQKVYRFSPFRLQSLNLAQTIFVIYV